MRVFLDFKDTRRIIQERQGSFSTGIIAHMHRKCLWKDRSLMIDSQKDKFVNEVSKIKSIVFATLVLGGLCLLLGATVWLFASHSEAFSVDIILSHSEERIFCAVMGVGVGIEFVALTFIKDLHTKIVNERKYFSNTPVKKGIKV